MNGIASKGQLRMSYLRWVLFTVPAIEFLGIVSARISNSGFGNRWFAMLEKPLIMPPGIAFAIVWPILYLLMGLAIAVILHARGARARGTAITLFVVQLLCNLAWSPLFFAKHEISLAFYLIIVILILAVATTTIFARIRVSAALLMMPYLIWLCFAAILNYQIIELNPGADTLVAPVIRTQI